MKTQTAFLISGAVAAAAALAAGITERVIQRRIHTYRREHEDLRIASEELQRRNEQLTALYNVFTEITESLSLRYVVTSTLHETLKLMRSDMSVLRVLRGDDLVVLGALAGNGKEIVGLAPVKLGEGPTGRAAKRGRPVILDEDAEMTMRTPAVGDDDDSMSPRRQTGAPAMESGIVLPLIVGARIVGTLSCWSREKFAFKESDERILEMLASQVATAVVAAEAMDTSERRAHHDALTDLPNRLQLKEDLQGDLAALVQSGGRAVFAMADIDHFKHFNDDFGHRVGDVTLQKVASILRTSVRDRDRVYRYGGEEFLLVFTDTGDVEAATLADRVRLAVASTPFSGDQLEPVGPVTLSMGLAVMPDHSTDLMHLIEMADAALYRAKDGGRNRVVMWMEDGSPLTEAA